jgi:S-formylglutathione hydrolase FrmB
MNRPRPRPVTRPAARVAGPHRPGPSGHHHLHRIAHLAQLHLPAGLLRQLDRAGPLERPLAAVGLAGLLAASVLLAVRWRGPGRHARRPGWLRRAGLAVWFSGLASATVLAGVNAYVGYVPSLPALLGRPAGSGDGGSQVVRLTIGAPDLDIPPRPAYVYLPPGYDDPANATRRYPVVYLLHGYPGGPLDWFRAGQAQQVMDAMLRDRLVQPMLIVAPDANGGWLHDSEMLNQVGGPQVETYLTRTVVRVVDGRYRTVADRAGRAVGGMSSGGYGALNLGLRHQDRFSVILGVMPYGDPGQAALGLLGGSRALWAANSPRLYIPTMAFHHPMAVDLLVGSRDPARVEAGRLAAMLEARGQDAVDTVTPGANHTWRAAHAELPFALAFASQHLRVPRAAGPLAAATRAGRP